MSIFEDITEFWNKLWISLKKIWDAISQETKDKIIQIIIDILFEENFRNYYRFNDHERTKDDFFTKMINDFFEFYFRNYYRQSNH